MTCLSTRFSIYLVRRFASLGACIYNARCAAPVVSPAGPQRHDSRNRFLLKALVACLAAVDLNGAHAQELPTPSEGRFLVTQVTWQGVAPDKVRHILDAGSKTLVNQVLSDGQIDAVTLDLTAQMRSAGIVVARVLVTPKDKALFRKTGILNLTVFQGNVGAISVHNDSRVSNNLIERIAEHALCSAGLGGSEPCVLSSDRLERMYLLLQDLPGVKVMPVTLSPLGVEVGQTSVELSTEQSLNAVAAAVSVDNYGVPETGTARVGASVSANNLLHIGDVFQASAIVTNEHQVSGSVGVSAPLGYLGWRGQASFSHSLFSIASVNSSGSADTGSLGVSYPLVRGLDQNWTMALDALDTISRQTVDGMSAFAPRHLYSARAMLSGNSGDRAMQLGDSYWSALAALTYGHVQQGLGSADTSDTLGAYTKLSVSAVEKYNLGSSGWYALVNVRGQASTANLDSSEKLSIGGQGGVRSYRADEGSVDEGVLVSLELRRLFRLPTGDQLAPGIFVDYANGLINHSTYANWQTSSGYANASLSNHRILSGFGVGIDWVSPCGISASLNWATRMPGSQDSVNYPGSARNRVLLSLGYHY